MSGALLVAAAVLLVGQDVPPELRAAQPRTIDPLLPAELRPVIEEASAAELDPKRGTGNAVEIVKAARTRVNDVPMKLQLDLRMAGFVLRSRFLADTKLPPTERAARALSTYSRLDLTEPGLAAWVKRAIDGAAPAVQKRLAAKDARRIRFYVATQGAGIDAAPMMTEVTQVLREMGFEVVPGTAQQADFVAKLSALEVRDEGGHATVRVTLDLAATQGAEPRWKRSYYRTAVAPDAKVALAGGVQWLTRMGGRDLLFAWLDAHGLEGAVMTMPGAHGDDDGHDHGGPARAPIVGAPAGSPPPRVQLGGSGGQQPSPPPKGHP